MDTSTIIIAVICIAICALPFVISGSSKKKQEKKMLRDLQNLAQSHGGRLDQHEFCNRFIIGMDSSTNHLYFIHKGKESEETVVYLDEVKSVSLQQINSGSGANAVIDRLALQLKYKDSKHPTTSLLMYDSNDSFQIGDELQVARKWTALVEKSLSANSVGRT